MVKRRELEYASGAFDSLEINASFYSLLSPRTYQDWFERTPRHFLFAVKGSRFITHNKKLRDCESALANFFASGILCLRDKLGPFVWQLPEHLHFDPERLTTFFALLPRNTEDAARLARKHDPRVEGRAWMHTTGRRRLRHALEVRHESYFGPECIRLLRRAGIALVVSDAADWPLREDVTASFVYVRLHGSRVTYASRYTDRELDDWAGRVRRWSEGGEPSDARRADSRRAPARRSRDVYVYFDNDGSANAPNDARRLRKRLRINGPG
jgi:uncharacterized protein YecE (DUF72 family)